MKERKVSKNGKGTPDKTQATDAKPKGKQYHPANEFGGPFGAFIGFVALPTIVYYLWICLEFYGGALQYPTSGADIGPFFTRMFDHILTHAMPTPKSTVIYLSWVALQAFLFAFAPGVAGQGSILPDGKTRLKYCFNGLFSWYFTLVLVGVLHFTGIFKISELYDNFAPLLTTASTFATLLAAACYFIPILLGIDYRMSGNFVYDFFMGSILNPRPFGFDIKFWAEIRPGIMLWFFLTLSMAAKQYELYGTVTAPMALMVFYHLCYANACYKGEECIPMSMDIIYEKFGWMLCWANLVWVPFTYQFPALYLIKVEPFNPHPAWIAFVLVLHVAGYYIFDTSNSQKDHFRKKEGEKELRKAFPVLPWGRLNKPTFIQTKRGTKLLTSGWWGIGRHMNYTGDLMMAWAWGLTCLFGSFIPFFYAVYMTILLIHREVRDDYDCRKKYGDDWDKYVKAVPYRLIPYIY